MVILVQFESISIRNVLGFDTQPRNLCMDSRGSSGAGHSIDVLLCIICIHNGLDAFVMA
jgi:hypothetical protein